MMFRIYLSDSLELHEGEASRVAAGGVHIDVDEQHYAESCEVAEELLVSHIADWLSCCWRSPSTVVATS